MKNLVIVALSIVTVGLLALTFKQHRELAAVVEPSGPATYVPPEFAEPAPTQSPTPSVAEAPVARETAPEALSRAITSETMEPMGGDASEMVGFPSPEQVRSQLEDMRALHQRYIVRAEAILSQDQLAQFETSLEQAVEMQETSLKVAGKMFREKEQLSTPEADTDR